MSTAEIKEMLLAFETRWRAKYGCAVTLADQKDLPQQILALYDQIGRRLNPEERAAANALWETKKNAAKAEAEAAAAKRAAIEETRAKQWAEFDAHKNTLWKSAVGDARNQREAVAVEAGVSALDLTGAATFVKPPDVERDSRPTREQYIQQACDERGLVLLDPTKLTEEEKDAEHAQWVKRGGAAADEAARFDQRSQMSSTEQHGLQ